MRQPDDMLRRLAALHPVIIDGREMWRLSRVKHALGISEDKTANQRIPKEHRKMVVLDSRDWRFRKSVMYIDIVGVEALILRYSGRLSRREALEALPRAP